MAVTTAAVIGAAATAKGAMDARKASKTAANAPAATVNIPALQTQAQQIALQNARNSAALEQQFNPGASQLRQGSLEALLASLNPENGSDLAALISGGAPGISTPGARPGISALGERPGVSAANTELLNRITAQAGNPLSNTGFDSALTRATVERAMGDLALGGQVPQDVRNLVARTAAARSGAVSGGLGLGRDITARDLGLTSLDLSQRRLQNAAQIGQQEAALEQANAAMRAASEQFGRNNLLQSQQALNQQDQQAAANYATDAQIQAARDAMLQQGYTSDAQLAAQRDQLASGNYFNQASLLQSIANGDFQKAFSAAQLGQNISQPASGLDPGSVANLAVGNSNAIASQAQNAAALKAQASNQLMGLGGNLLGLAGSYYANRAPVPAYTPPAGAPSYYGGTPVGNFGF